MDVRTVRRYITHLQDVGIPVEATIGRHGGYRLRPGFKLPPLMFTDGEALALTLGLLAARRLGLTDAASAAASAQAKLERVLPARVKRRVRAFCRGKLSTESATAGRLMPERHPAERGSNARAASGRAGMS